jgi:hypothetical protein
MYFTALIVNKINAVFLKLLEKIFLISNLKLLK